MTISANGALGNAQSQGLSLSGSPENDRGTGRLEGRTFDAKPAGKRADGGHTTPSDQGRPLAFTAAQTASAKRAVDVDAQLAPAATQDPFLTREGTVQFNGPAPTIGATASGPAASDNEARMDKGSKTPAAPKTTARGSRAGRPRRELLSRICKFVGAGLTLSAAAGVTIAAVAVGAATLGPILIAGLSIAVVGVILLTAGRIIRG